MLEIRPNCETCDKGLSFDSKDAWICSFECTFCTDCVENTHQGTCPNCGGGFERRPVRPVGLIEQFPPSTKRVKK